MQWIARVDFMTHSAVDIISVDLSSHREMLTFRLAHVSASVRLIGFWHNVLHYFLAEQILAVVYIYSL